MPSAHLQGFRSTLASSGFNYRPCDTYLHLLMSLSNWSGVNDYRLSGSWNLLQHILSLSFLFITLPTSHLTKLRENVCGACHHYMKLKTLQIFAKTNLCNLNLLEKEKLHIWLYLVHCGSLANPRNTSKARIHPEMDTSLLQGSTHTDSYLGPVSTVKLSAYFWEVEGNRRILRKPILTWGEDVLHHTDSNPRLGSNCGAWSSQTAALHAAPACCTPWHWYRDKW